MESKTTLTTANIVRKSYDIFFSRNASDNDFIKSYAKKLCDLTVSFQRLSKNIKSDEITKTLESLKECFVALENYNNRTFLQKLRNFPYMASSLLLYKLETDEDIAKKTLDTLFSNIESNLETLKKAPKNLNITKEKEQISLEFKLMADFIKNYKNTQTKQNGKEEILSLTANSASTMLQTMKTKEKLSAGFSSLKMAAQTCAITNLEEVKYLFTHGYDINVENCLYILMRESSNLGLKFTETIGKLLESIQSFENQAVIAFDGSILRELYMSTNPEFNSKQYKAVMQIEPVMEDIKITQDPEQSDYDLNVIINIFANKLLQKIAKVEHLTEFIQNFIQNYEAKEKAIEARYEELHEQAEHIADNDTHNFVAETLNPQKLEQSLQPAPNNANSNSFQLIDCTRSEKASGSLKNIHFSMCNSLTNRKRGPSEDVLSIENAKSLTLAEVKKFEEKITPMLQCTELEHTGGTTYMHVNYNKEKNELIVSNLGDSIAGLELKNEKGERNIHMLSTLHSTTNQDEILENYATSDRKVQNIATQYIADKRFVTAKISDAKTEHSLAISRSFGDIDNQQNKSLSIKCDHYVFSLNNKNVASIIIGSDGLTDKQREGLHSYTSLLESNVFLNSKNPAELIRNAASEGLSKKQDITSDDITVAYVKAEEGKFTEDFSILIGDGHAGSIKSRLLALAHNEYVETGTINKTNELFLDFLDAISNSKKEAMDNNQKKRIIKRIQNKVEQLKEDFDETIDRDATETVRKHLQDSKTSEFMKIAEKQVMNEVNKELTQKAIREEREIIDDAYNKMLANLGIVTEISHTVSKATEQQANNGKMEVY